MRQQLQSLLLLLIAFPMVSSAEVVSDELVVKTEFIAEAINAMAPITSGKSTVVSASNKDNELIILVELNAPHMESMTEEDQKAIVPVFQKAFVYKTCTDPEQKQFVEGGGILTYDMIETTSGIRLDTTIESCPSDTPQSDTSSPPGE